MLKWIGRLFCKHKWEIKIGYSQHYSWYDDGSYEYDKCEKCGKVRSR